MVPMYYFGLMCLSACLLFGFLSYATTSPRFYIFGLFVRRTEVQ